MILNWIIRFMEVVSSLVLVSMMVLTFVDVVGRYLLNAPIFGASEMISTMLAMVIFTGMGIANSRDSHIVVELIDTPIRNLAPGVYDFIIHGFSILAMVLIVYVLFEQAIEASHTEKVTIVLEWPLAWITGIVASVAALSVVSQILGLVTGAYAKTDHHLEDMS